MTTKDKIKALISIDRVISQAIGHSESSPGVDKEMFNNLINTREKLEAVIFALCDELPDHIANPGKKVFVGDSRTELGLQDPEHIADLGKMMYGGQPVNLCAKEEE